VSDERSTKPCYGVALVGLDASNRRLIEIVFRHIQYNRFVFRLVPTPESADIVIAGGETHEAGGAAADERGRIAGRPWIAVLDPETSSSCAGYVLPATELVRQVLPLLNRVVESERLVARPAPSVAAHVSPTDLLPPQARPRVLVVGADPTALEELSVAFERMAVPFELATCGTQAIERLDRPGIALVLLDLDLHAGTGLQWVRRIRSRADGGALPIVALAARPGALNVIRGALAGCSAYLARPVAYADLSRTMGRLLPAPQGHARDGARTGGAVGLAGAASR
jgi:CheY-like chemotaxis protein